MGNPTNPDLCLENIALLPDTMVLERKLVHQTLVSQMMNRLFSLRMLERVATMME
jgi:hypothetical protein